jgi:amidohydrolase
MVLMAACGMRKLSEDGQPVPSARLRFVFQPAEESSQGAHWMVESGAMAGVAAILSVHVDPMYPVGRVGIRYGVLTAHCDEVLLRIEGRGGHSARPYLTTDPISAAAQLIRGLYQNLPRCVDVRSPAVFTIGRVRAGEAANVIPDHVEMSGSLRTIDTETRELLIQRLQDVCRSVETATANRITVGLHNSLEAVHNDPRLTAALETVARAILGDEAIYHLDRPSMGGEDFSVYLKHAPGAMLRLGCRGSEPEWPGLHSPFFDVDEQVLDLGTSLVLRTALLVAASRH